MSQAAHNTDAVEPQTRNDAGDEPASMRRLRALLAELERDLRADSAERSSET